MNHPIHTEYGTVRVSQVQTEHQLKITALLDWMQDVAYTHSNKLESFSTDVLLRRNLSWALMRMFILVFNLPHLGQDLTLSTYPSSLSRYFAFRDYELRDMQNNPMVLATSTWAVFDLSKRRIIKTPADFFQGFAPPKSANLEFKRSKIPPLRQFQKSQTVYIRENDLDLNGHVNHSCMADWVLLGLTPDWGSNSFLKELDIVFRSECTLQNQAVSTLSAIWGEASHGSELNHLHSIKDLKHEQEFARAVSTWTRS